MGKAFHSGVPVASRAFSKRAVDDRKQRMGVVQRQYPRGNELLVVPQEQSTLRHLVRKNDNIPHIHKAFLDWWRGATCSWSYQVRLRRSYKDVQGTQTVIS